VGFPWITEKFLKFFLDLQLLVKYFQYVPGWSGDDVIAGRPMRRHTKGLQSTLRVLERGGVRHEEVCVS